MDDTILKVSMACFFHDMGKFCGRAVLGMERSEINENRGDFLPKNNCGGYSHEHALFTAEFIERYSDYLPVEMGFSSWGEGESLVRLAAAHHNPSSPMEWIVAEADRLSSGMDRKDYNEADNEGTKIKDFEKTRLVPVFEIVDYEAPEKNLERKHFKMAYPLKPLSHDTIFPSPKEQIEPEKTETAKEEYQALFDDFLKELKTLGHRDHVALWFEHFESLVMRYAGSIPSARVKNTIPDVSLYDHLKTTAAIGTALYVYHLEQDSMNEAAIKDEKEKKFLVISIDFSGIQNFIFGGYGDTRKYRSKLLRGRSFYVSLMTELAADLLLREIGLPFSSVVLNAGGKLTLIAPNTKKAAASYEMVRKKIENWLVAKTYGETVILFSMIKAAPSDFKYGSFQKLQEQIHEAQMRRKFNRFDLTIHGGVVDDYFNEAENEKKICTFCGKRPGFLEKNKKHICSLCKDHIQIGENLVKKREIAIFYGDTDKNDLNEKIFGIYGLSFSDSGEFGKEAENGELAKLWESSIGSTGQNRFTLKLINGYVPVYTNEDEHDHRLSKGTDEEERVNIGAPKTLNHISEKAFYSLGNGKFEGVAALGVLKADVDNLGLIMACGIDETYYTISRLAALSRQMNNFFTVYLPWFLAHSKLYKDIYTVFAGGDDLFLIGPWNKMADLGADLDGAFRSYMAYNPKIHFSAGITIHKSHTPMDKMAEASEAALEKSKEEKGAITVFDETVTWEELGQLKKTSDDIDQWLESGMLTGSMLYKLNQFVDMAKTEARVLSSGVFHVNSMACTKWRALLAYAVERNIGKNVKKEERSDRVKEIHGKLANWLEMFGGKIRIPLWTLQYNLRKKR